MPAIGMVYLRHQSTSTGDEQVCRSYSPEEMGARQSFELLWPFESGKTCSNILNVTLEGNFVPEMETLNAQRER